LNSTSVVKSGSLLGLRIKRGERKEREENLLDHMRVGYVGRQI
jgi:hypothetical protein